MKQFLLLQVFAIVASLFTIAVAQCGDMTQYRSSFVRDSFDVNKVAGRWFEVYFHDIAQIKETCQYYDKTISGNLAFPSSSPLHKSGISETYGFTNAKGNLASFDLFYYNTNTTGVFDRAADYPVIRKFTFPSVIVDVMLNDQGDYDILTEYLCSTVAGITYTEIRVGSRSNQPLTSRQLAAVETTLKNVGIPFEMIKPVDHSGCSYL